eukprot:403355779
MEDSQFFYEKDPYQKQKIMSIIGCMICQFIFGGCNIWGNIQVYVCSYLRIYDPEIQINQVFIVQPIQSLSLTIGNLIGTRLITRYRPRTFIGGVGLGMNFFLPVYVGWKCFPLKKGLVTSLIMCFNGVGTITQALVSVLIVNPENAKPSIQVDAGKVTYNYYDDSISQNVPIFFRIFAGVELILLVFALKFIWIPPYELEREDEIKMPWNVEQDNNVKLRTVLSSRQFFQSYFMMFTGVLYFQYISIVFKPFGEYHGHDDQFLTLSASIVLSFSFSYVADYKIGFMLYLALSYYVSGSVFVSTPVYYGKVFGPEIGSQAYAYFFTSNAIACLSFSYVVRNYTSVLGYSGMLLITGITSTLSFIDLVLLPDSPFIFKRHNLLDDVRENYQSGPLIHECTQEFAHASFIMRKNTYMRRASQINSSISMSAIRRQQSAISNISIPRHENNRSVISAMSGFGKQYHKAQK